MYGETGERVEHKNTPTFNTEFPSTPYLVSCFVGRDCKGEIEYLG